MKTPSHGTDHLTPPRRLPNVCEAVPRSRDIDMFKVYTSSVLSAPVEAVWAWIRDFNDLPKWVPAIGKSEIEGKTPSDQVGCVRKITFADGGVARERLLSLSDHDHLFAYTLLEVPLPLENYIAHVRLTPITDGNRTFIEWWSEFDSPQGQQMTAALTGIYMLGFKTLQQRFET